MTKVKKEITAKESGAIGGNRTLRKYGPDHFVKAANARWHPKKKRSKGRK